MVAGIVVRSYYRTNGWLVSRWRIPPDWSASHRVGRLADPSIDRIILRERSAGIRVSARLQIGVAQSMAIANYAELAGGLVPAIGLRRPIPE
jgi:hypothetical protein